MRRNENATFWKAGSENSSYQILITLTLPLLVQIIPGTEESFDLLFSGPSYELIIVRCFLARLNY